MSDERAEIERLRVIVACVEVVRAKMLDPTHPITEMPYVARTEVAHLLDAALHYPDRSGPKR